MPIKPENKKRYPANWKEIRAEILERANHECEWCGKPNLETVGIVGHGDRTLWWNEARRGWIDVAGRDPKHGQFDGIEWLNVRHIKVVLTIAHLDHTPENNHRRNLRALCQGCHNRYDAPHRAETRRNSKRDA